MYSVLVFYSYIVLPNIMKSASSSSALKQSAAGVRDSTQTTLLFV